MEYVIRLNIERFETLIEKEADQIKLATLRALLNEERRKLSALGLTTAS